MKIQGFSNYEIHPNEGKIWSYKSNKFIGAKNKDGYWCCTLYADNGAKCNKKVHRVVWQCVNGDIPKGYEISHIDENPSNNNISNLELVTHKENINYGSRNERAREANTNGKCSKQVAAFKDGVLMMIFPSTQEAQRNGYDQSSVSQCCNGLRQSHKGFQWRYL